MEYNRFRKQKLSNENAFKKKTPLYEKIVKDINNKLQKKINKKVIPVITALERMIRNRYISFYDVADVGRTAEDSDLAIGVIYLLTKYKRDFELAYLMRCKDENPVLRRREVSDAFYHAFKRLEEDFIKHDGKGFWKW